MSKTTQANADERVIAGFGAEWARFDQADLAPEELGEMFAAYFANFPWQKLGPESVGFDLGCGTGRWARLVAPRVGLLHCIDPSAALAVARRNLAGLENCRFHARGVDAIPLPDGSADFGYSLGVLHHVPDTAAGIEACVAKLRPGAPFLLYLYYALDNRPAWFRRVWRCAEALRRGIARLPWRGRCIVADAIAVTAYWPLARLAWMAERCGLDADGMLLSGYRHRSFYTMRTDALDRFGTRLEQRFTRAQIEAMMKSAGLDSIRFNDHAPYWCAIGFRANA